MATMDEAIPDTKPAPSAAKAPHGDQRRSARELLAAQRQMLERLEDDLGDRLRNLSEHVESELGNNAPGQRTDPVSVARITDLEQQLETSALRLEQQSQSLAEMRAQLERSQLAQEQFEQELRVRNALLGEAQKGDEARRIELATLREQVADLQAQLNASRSRQDELRVELASQVEQLAKAQDEARMARRRAARKYRRRLLVFKDQFDGQMAEVKAEHEARQRQLEAESVERIEQLEADLKATYAGRLAELEARHAEAVKQSEHRHSAEASEQSREQAQQAATLEEQTRRLKELEAQQAERSAELDRREADLTAKANKKDGDKTAKTKRMETELAELRGELEQAKAQLDTASANGAATRELEARLAQLQSERDALAKQLAAAQAKQAEPGKGADTRKLDDLQRRLDLAMEDLRESRRANSELEAKLSKARIEPKSSAGSPGGSLNWEAQKEKLLAALEADDRHDEEAIEERQTMEGTIRITDQIVAQKDKEIAELRRQLSEVPTAATGEQTAAIADLLDHDETIRQERERLEAACAEWREKIGKAEIDISVERAKLARERMELEEKVRNLQSEQSRRPAGDSTDESSKAPRGRWLARLGLKDLDDK